MTIEQIRNMPTVIERIESGSRGNHESTVRSYHVMDKIYEWSKMGAAPEIIVELIEACYPEKKRG